MATFKLIHGSCAGQTADAVVNAANSGLWEGGGICGVIFSKCGSKEHPKLFLSFSMLITILFYC